MPVQVYPALTGNWQIQSASAAPATTGFLLLGALSNTDGNVTGTMRVSSLVPLNPCVTNQIVTVTGTVTSTTRTLNLTTSPFAGGSVLKVQLALPIETTPSGTGTLTVEGGSCTYGSSPVTGVLVSVVNGTFTGTLTPSGGYPVTPSDKLAVSLSLAQSSTPAVDGEYLLTGSLQVSSSTCAATNTPFTGTVSGVGVLLTRPLTGLVTALSGFAILNPSATQMPTVSVVLSPIPCGSGTLSSGTYEGSLTKQ